MTILKCTEAKRGEEVFGLKTGQALFVDHESRCFYFVEAPALHYGKTRLIKISKLTMRCCSWSNQSTSPCFALDELEAVEETLGQAVARDQATISTHRA